MAHQIHIPEPCHEDWNDMLPEANGRHCLQCCKTVVDFSGWEVEAIAGHLKNATGSTCGRFTADQVQAPAQPEPLYLAHYVIRASMPLYRKMAAIIILFFGLSVSACDAQIKKGKPAVTQQHLLGDTVLPQKPIIMGAVPLQVTPDTAKDRPLLMGKPACSNSAIPPDSLTIPTQHMIKGRVHERAKTKPKPKHKAIQQEAGYLQGDVQVIDPATPQKVQQPEAPPNPKQNK